jgi:hypothetical protein
MLVYRVTVSPLRGSLRLESTTVCKSGEYQDSTTVCKGCSLPTWPAGNGDGSARALGRHAFQTSYGPAIPFSRFPAAAG